MCLKEIERLTTLDISVDGFAACTVYRTVGLGDCRLEPVWKKPNARKAL